MASPAVTVTQKAPGPASRKGQVWVWEARTKQGEIKKGEMEAGDAEAVNNRLKSLGLNPTKVKRKPLEISIKLPGIGGVTGKDILVFTRQFATMIDAGLPLVQCLDILGSQMDNPAFRK